MTLIDFYVTNELKTLISLSMTTYLNRIKADASQFLQIHDAENYNNAAVLLNNLNYLLPIDVNMFEAVIFPEAHSRLITLLLPRTAYPTTSLNGPSEEETIYENKKQIIYILNYYNTKTINKL